MRQTTLILLLMGLMCCKKSGSGGGGSTTPPPSQDSSFANPISPYADPDDFADPSVVYSGGSYYYVRSSHGSTELDVYKADRLEDIYYKSTRAIVWTAPSGGDHCTALWAPEIKYLRGHWYIYYTATTADGAVANHHMFVLVGNSQDPQGAYADSGQVVVPGGYAIDGAVLVKPSDSSLYFVWSGGLPSQRLYIALMKDPLHLDGGATELGATMLSWENDINEAPAFLTHGGSTFISYSTGYVTSASTTSGYKMGLLVNTNGNYLDAAAWTKNASPILQYYSGYDGTVYSPGSNAFVKSPDGAEDWIVYHAKHAGDDGIYDRELRMQLFTWGQDGLPVFGHAIPSGVPQSFPSGE